MQVFESAGAQTHDLETHDLETRYLGTHDLGTHWFLSLSFEFVRVASSRDPQVDLDLE